MELLWNEIAYKNFNTVLGLHEIQLMIKYQVTCIKNLRQKLCSVCYINQASNKIRKKDKKFEAQVNYSILYGNKNHNNLFYKNNNFLNNTITSFHNKYPCFLSHLPGWKKMFFFLFNLLHSFILWWYQLFRKLYYVRFTVIYFEGTSNLLQFKMI